MFKISENNKSRFKSYCRSGIGKIPAALAVGSVKEEKVTEDR